MQVRGIFEVASSLPSTGPREVEGSRIAQSSCTTSTGSSCHLVTDFSTERQNLLYLDVDVTLWGFEKKKQHDWLH